MHPEKYRRELEYLSRKSRILEAVLFLVSFVSSYYLLAPMLHEAGHAFVLLASGCRYTLDIGFNIFTGLTGTVDPLCRLGRAKAAVFQVSGYFTAITAGITAFYLSLRKENGTPVDIAGGFAIGALSSSVATIRLRGDIHRLSEIMRIGQHSALLEALSVVTILLLALYLLEKTIQNGKKGAETRP